MSSVEPTGKKEMRVSKGAAPQWDEWKMRQRTRRLFFALAGVVAGIWVFLIAWVLFLAPIMKAEVKILPVGADVALALAPVLAAAAGVERVL